LGLLDFVFDLTFLMTLLEQRRAAVSDRILLVEDFESWRCCVRSIIQKQPELQIVGEVADGLAAVRKAEELKPDLILLDIGLPKLNGIDAARKIRTLASNSKILFLSQEISHEVARAALKTGDGFVVKADAYVELLSAISAVLLDRQFVSSRLESSNFGGAPGRLIFEV
jgi:DNA-binding NarL/FixJ family response regulator